jgi:uncharacterized membrane protein
MRHAHSERLGFISMRHAMLLPLLAVFLLSVAPVLKAQSSTAYCDQYARSYAQQYGANGQVVRGAARGALLGAGIGAFSGRAGRGAAIGAGIGAIGGGVRRAHNTSHVYHQVYRDCLAGYYD